MIDRLGAGLINHMTLMKGFNCFRLSVSGLWTDHVCVCVCGGLPGPQK